MSLLDPRTCVVQLGRYGDILNALPLVERISQSSRPALMVQSAFLDLGKAISYADVIEWKGDIYDVAGARRQAERAFTRVVVPQVTGQAKPDLTCRTGGFMEQAYKLAGPEWHRGFLAGEFDAIHLDRRDLQREEALFATQGLDPKKRLILFNTRGHSSPFPHGGVLKGALAALPNVQLLDLGQIQAGRFTDLLGFLDRAALLVTTDTGTLHLAGALGTVPYIAILNDTPGPWHKGYCRGHCVMQASYSKVQEWLPYIKAVAEDCFGGTAGRIWAPRGRNLRGPQWGLWPGSHRRSFPGRDVHLAP